MGAHGTGEIVVVNVPAGDLEALVGDQGARRGLVLRQRQPGTVDLALAQELDAGDGGRGHGAAQTDKGDPELAAGLMWHGVVTHWTFLVVPCFAGGP